MTLHLPIGHLKTALGWSRYRDANPVPTIPLADDITNAPLGLVRDDEDEDVMALHQPTESLNGVLPLCLQPILPTPILPTPSLPTPSLPTV